MNICWPVELQDKYFLSLLLKRVLNTLLACSRILVSCLLVTEGLRKVIVGNEFLFDLPLPLCAFLECAWTVKIFILFSFFFFISLHRELIVLPVTHNIFTLIIFYYLFLPLCFPSFISFLHRYFFFINFHHSFFYIYIFQNQPHTIEYRIKQATCFGS